MPSNLRGRNPALDRKPPGSSALGSGPGTPCWVPALAPHRWDTSDPGREHRIGIDGLNSSTVEQDGTLVQSPHGHATYYGWWETYPASAVLPFGSIHAGDKFTASVTGVKASGSFYTNITDTTSSTSWAKVSTNSGAMENGAECIAERPAGARNSSGLYALAKFAR